MYKLSQFICTKSCKCEKKCGKNKISLNDGNAHSVSINVMFMLWWHRKDSGHWFVCVLQTIINRLIISILWLASAHPSTTKLVPLHLDWSWIRFAGFDIAEKDKSSIQFQYFNFFDDSYYLPNKLMLTNPSDFPIIEFNAKSGGANASTTATELSFNSPQSRKSSDRTTSANELCDVVDAKRPR